MGARNTESSSDHPPDPGGAGPSFGSRVAVLTAVVASMITVPASHGIGLTQQRLAAPEWDVDGRTLRLGMERAEILRRLEVHGIDDLDGVYEGRYVLRRDRDEPRRWALFSRGSEGQRDEYLGDLVIDDGLLVGWRKVRVMPAGTDAATLAADLLATVERLLPGSDDGLPGRSLPAPEVLVAADGGSMLVLRFAGQDVRLTLGAPDDDESRTVALIETAGTEAD